MPVSKKRVKKTKKAEGNLRAQFRRDARKTMRTTISALQGVTTMRVEVARNFENFPKEFLSSVETKERDILSEIQKMETKAEEIINNCNVEAKSLQDWEVEDMPSAVLLSQELESTSDDLVAKCIEAAAELQI
jgi:hypothetical protein